MNFKLMYQKVLKTKVEIRIQILALVLATWISFWYTHIFRLGILKFVSNGIVKNKFLFLFLFIGTFIFFQQFLKLTYKIERNIEYIFWENSTYCINGDYLIIKNDFIKEEIDLNKVKNIKLDDNFIFLKSANTYYKIPENEEILEIINKLREA